MAVAPGDDGPNYSHYGLGASLTYAEDPWPRVHLEEQALYVECVVGLLLSATNALFQLRVGKLRREMETALP